MKLVKYLSYLLLAVSAVLVIAFYAMGTPESMVSTVLGWAYILLGLALVSMLVLPLFFRDGKKTNKSTLVAYGIFAVVVLVAVLFSSDAPLEGVTTSVEPSATDLKFTDGGVMAAGLLIAVSFVAIIVGSLKNMFSK
jgi:Na+(H+)/acetate symporter ActP